MVDALYRVDLDVGFLVSREVDVGEDQQRLRAVGYVEGAVEVHRLDAAFLTSGLVEGVGERHGFVVDLVGEMRGQQRNGQRNRGLDLYAEFLAIVVGRHQAVDLGRRGHLVFFVQDAAPVELGQDAIVHTIPCVVLDVEVVGRHELPRAGPENHADGRDDRLFRFALVAEGDDHRALRGQMALIDRIGDMLLHAEKVEVKGGIGMLHRGGPFVGPSHGDGDGISRLDADMHVATSGRRMVDAAAVPTGGLHGDGLVVGRGPVENAIILRARDGGEGAEQQRGEDGEIPHIQSICRVQAST